MPSDDAQIEVAAHETDKDPPQGGVREGRERVASTLLFTLHFFFLQVSLFFLAK